MTQVSRPIVCGVSYSAGTRIALENLAELEGISPSVIAPLKARGLRYFRSETRSLHDVLFDVASSCLDAAGCTVADIDGIVIVNSPVNEEQFVKTLSMAGFERAWLVGLSFQDCGGCEAALRIASDLVQGAGRSKRLLVVLHGKIYEGESRIGWGGETVFSDGVSACVVSTAGSGLEILASEVLTNPKLPWFREVGSQAKYFEECLSSMGEVAGHALRLAGIDIQQVSRIFATNGSSVYHTIIASALRISTEKIHRDELAEFGHVFSSDALIGLSNYMSTQTLHSGQYIMLVSWSPYVFGATILRKT